MGTGATAAHHHGHTHQPPDPGKKEAAGASPSPIEHVVMIVKENHTLDNYFGTFPGVNGTTEPHAPDPVKSDPPHDHSAWLHRNNPAPGGARRMQYLKEDIPAYWALAQQYTLCDQYYTEIASQSEPNHLVLIAGTTPLIDNSSAHRTYQPQPPYDINSLPTVPRGESLREGWHRFEISFAHQHREILLAQLRPAVSGRFRRAAQ
jgi:phospholipase C